MSYSIFPKQFRIVLLILFVCLFPLAPVAHGVVCNPPSVITGCTVTLPDSGVTVSAEVAAPSSVVEPTVDTEPAVVTGETTATLNGDLTDLGDSPVTLQGFHYGTSISFGLPPTTATSSGFGTGPFSANLTGLACGTQYFYEAYATNLAGEDQGSTETFTTETCSVVPTPVPSPGGGGVITTSTVNFYGMAYPGATVTVLRDGVVIVNAIAGSDGTFVATAAGLGMGSYVFSAYARDPKGTVSATSSFPFVLNGKSIINISGIILAPTLDLDKSIIQLSEKLTASGYGAPNTEIRIRSSQFSQVFTTRTNAQGFYSYLIDAGLFSTGAYTIRAEETVNGQQSPQSRGRMFLVGLSNLPPGTKPGTRPIPGECVPADLNCDGRVDIVDYSIMKYWYKQPNPPTKVDLSGDGTVGLKDFSILAAEWTG